MRYVNSKFLRNFFYFYGIKFLQIKFIFNFFTSPLRCLLSIIWRLFWHFARNRIDAAIFVIFYRKYQPRWTLFYRDTIVDGE